MLSGELHMLLRGVADGAATEPADASAETASPPLLLLYLLLGLLRSTDVAIQCLW
jgi:hypothetical protein